MIPRRASLLIAVLATAVYAGMWVGVATQWSWPVLADTRAVERLHGYGVDHPAWTSAWRLLSELFSPNSLRIVGAIGIVVALCRRRSRIAGFLAVTILPAGLVTAAAKALGDRPRPETALTEAASSSFPSGHALGITVGVLAVGTLIWPRVRTSFRVPLIAAGAALVFLVGLSRVVLNVHYPSDVVAGWALGLLYYLLCLALIPPRARVSAV